MGVALENRDTMEKNCAKPYFMKNGLEEMDNQVVNDSIYRFYLPE